ncbi:MAG: LysM peptidoglycan-binding domain-containing M23 family metallopeptidase [Chloroflexota bacterium]|nr:LysM peptidoglycan-binding domain-containing M23 family metallopeptidase [Chloroflexota bacterium]
MHFRRSLMLASLVLWMALSLPSLAAPLSQEGEVHIVRAGETLTQIALRYGVSVVELASTNELADPDLILVGQRLLIPSTEPPQIRPGFHIVRAGETLSLIAKQYGVPVADLIAANGLADPDLILVGQQLAIPQAQPALPAPFVKVRLSPNPAIQGQTLVIRVRTEGRLRVRGAILGQEFDFVTEASVGGEAWALVGVPVSTEPGRYELSLIAEGFESEAHLWLTVLAGDFGTDYIQFSPEDSRLLDPELLKEERAKLHRYWSHTRPSKLWRGSFRLPIADDTPVSSPFGTRRSYNGQPASSYHAGIDFAALEGTPIYAPAAGRVVLAEELTVRGGGVLIDHGWGVISGYFHLSDIEVKAGENVEGGDLIGRVGSTGLSTGNHLHWEIRVRGVPVDPRQWTQRATP